MRYLFIALLMFGLSMAFTVHPDYFEIKDSGNQNQGTMDVDITIDCDSKALTVTARSNETGQPVQNAGIYLFYTDYEYQLITTGNTGSSGTGTINVMGNQDYLTALFILRVDSTQYRSREVEFGYEKCFGAPPAEPKPPRQNDTPQGNHTPPPPPENVTPPQNQTSPDELPGQPGNQTGEGNGNTGQPIVPPAPVGGTPCLPAFLLILIPILITRR
ncbi:hypothetical protein H0O00_04160 [Candidatus Micrarchaeota archaeon]|nr:hypothetical protein [Candidatus Micrarchaeota archaeon]